MKAITLATSAIFLLTSLHAAEFENAKDSSGVIGYKDTYKLPWCDYVIKLYADGECGAIYGETRHRVPPAYHKSDSVGPISLPAHYCPVRLRNIWVRPLKSN
jgi:hypothetical protein